MENVSTSKMEVKYLGTNTLVFIKGDTVLMIDPHFSRPGLPRLFFGLRPNRGRISEGLQMAGVDQLGAVLLTHTHYDHALDFSEVIRSVGGEAYGSESGRNIILGSGLPGALYNTVKPGEDYRIGEVSVCFHPARHIAFPPPLRWLLPESGKISKPLQPPVPFWTYSCGEVYAVQVDDTLVFGSAGFEPGAYAGLDVHSVILGIGGLETKPKSYLRRLYTETVLASGAGRVWLSHWDNFFQPLNQELKPLGLSGWTVRRMKTLGAEYGQDVEELPFNERVLL